MDRGRAVVALLAVAGVAAVAAPVPDGASGLPGAGAVRAVAALPRPVAQEPRVAFTLDRDRLAEVDLTFGVESDEMGYEYVLVDAEPGEVRPVSADEPGRLHEGESSSVPDGDGDAPAAYAFVGTGEEPGSVDVHVRVPPPDADPLPPEEEWATVRVTCDDAQETHPVLSGDGTRVAYATDASGDWEVVVAPVAACAGDDAVAHAPGPGADDLWPAWGPYDASLFFSSTRDDPLGDLYVVGLGGEETPGVEADPVVRLTHDPGADTMPVLVATPSEENRVLFTTTRFDPQGSLASIVLPYYWWPGSSEALDVERLGAELPGPVVGEVSARPVRLDTLDPGLLLAYTAVDRTSGLPEVWVAYVRIGWWGTEVVGAWRVPVDGGASHPDWASVTPMVGNPSTGLEQEGTATLRLTQRTGQRTVADALVADGSDVRDLLGAAADRVDDAGPVYSPDGARLAFAAELPEEGPEGLPVREVAVLRPGGDAAGGSAPQTLVPGDTTYAMASPDWSPDASRIAFSGYVFEQESPGVWWADTATGATDSARDPDGGYPLDVRHPSWSPDGTRVVAEVPIAWDDGRPPALAVLDVATKSWTPLAIDRVDDCDREVEEDVCPSQAVPLHGRDPAWSPDGTRIAVTDLRVMDASTGSGGASALAVPYDVPVDVAPGGIGLVELDPASSATGQVRAVGVRAVTGFDASQDVLTEQPEVVGPSPEPTEEPEAGPGATPSRAAVVRSDGPAWSPDGTEIVFSGQPAGRPDDRDVYAVAPDGTGLRTLVDTPAALTQPDLQAVGDLAVTVAVDVPEVAVGAEASVTVTVANDGLVPATPDVLLVVPPGLTVGTPPDGCAVAGADQGGSVVTCTDPAPLVPGASRAVVVPVVGAAPGAVDVSGAVVNPGAEDDVEDNVATARVTVTGGGGPDGDPDGDPALTVEVTVTEPRIWVGGQLVNAITTVGNDGDGTAQDVWLTVEPPPGAVDPNAESLAASRSECPQCTSPMSPDDGIRVWTRIDAVGPAGKGVVTATVTSEGADPIVATTPLEVVQPWLQVVPAVARPGEVVLAYGEDFPPGAEIHLTWSSGITTAPGPYTVGPDGRVSIPVLVVRNDVRGERWLRVTSGSPTDLRGVLGRGFPRVVPTPPGGGGIPAAVASSTPVAPPCLDDPALAPTPGDLSWELRDVTPTGPRWCELDAPLLVVTPSVGVPDVLERR